MNQKLEIQELAIVITAKNYDPSLLNPNLLKYSGIVTADWELAKEPISSSHVSQIVFTNGVYLVAQPNRLMFVESLNNQENIKEAEIPQIANRYIEIMRTLQYQAVGINFTGYKACSDTTLENNNYVMNNFIQPGEWQNCGTKPVKAGLNLLFDYEDKQFNLNINEAALELPNSEPLPIVLFGGNFNYDLSLSDLEEVLPRLNSVINNWQQDLDIYREVIGKTEREQLDHQSRGKTSEAVTRGNLA